MIRRWLALTYYFCTPCGSPPCLIFILIHYTRRVSRIEKQPAHLGLLSHVQAAFLRFNRSALFGFWLFQFVAVRNVCRCGEQHVGR